MRLACIQTKKMANRYKMLTYICFSLSFHAVSEEFDIIHAMIFEFPSISYFK